jgi:hypothetical protein
MNCNPGEIAIVVFSRGGGNEGKIVTCIQPLQHTFLECGTVAAWVTEPMLENRLGIEVPTPDHQLRPIRDPGDDAVDESKEWLPPVPPPILAPSLLEVGK